RTQTGLPRHSTRSISPGASLLMSTSTGAPSAFARSEGSILAAKGTAAPTAAMPPTTEVATNNPRLLLSSSLSLMLCSRPRHCQKLRILPERQENLTLSRIIARHSATCLRTPAFEQGRDGAQEAGAPSLNRRQ